MKHVRVLGVRKIGDDLYASWPEIAAPTKQSAQERCLAEQISSAPFLRTF